MILVFILLLLEQRPFQSLVPENGLPLKIIDFPSHIVSQEKGDFLGQDYEKSNLLSMLDLKKEAINSYQTG
jgi:hypothetical protein